MIPRHHTIVSGFMDKYYSGVGSRESPDFVCRAMFEIAQILEGYGYILRSGGADGADLAFEGGVVGVGMKHIYLAKKGFNGSTSQLYTVGEDALELAATIHPAWDKCKSFARLLHARNCYQVLGLQLDEPSDFLICWTENAEKRGGTRTAIVLAERHKIPVLNLGKCKTYEECMIAFDRFYLMVA